MNQDADPDYYSGSFGSIEHRKANDGNGAGVGSEGRGPNGPNKREWLQPRPLPNGLAPVEAFSKRFLPEAKLALEKAQLKRSKQANVDIDFQIGEEPKEPMLLRYRTNDT